MVRKLKGSDIVGSPGRVLLRCGFCDKETPDIKTQVPGEALGMFVVINYCGNCGAILGINMISDVSSGKSLIKVASGGLVPNA